MRQEILQRRGVAARLSGETVDVVEQGLAAAGAGWTAGISCSSSGNSRIGWPALSPWPGPLGPNAVALAARSGTAGVGVGAGEEVAGAGVR